MRLIDADALHKAYMELRNFKQDPQSGDWILLRAVPLTTVIRMLNEAPTIDAVSVVRCKECRYKDMEICAMYRLVVAGVRKYDDYCSYGERKNND